MLSSREYTGTLTSGIDYVMKNPRWNAEFTYFLISTKKKRKEGKKMLFPFDLIAQHTTATFISILYLIDIIYYYGNGK